MEENKKPLVYLLGDIMTKGSQLAREYEYNKVDEAGLLEHLDVYSACLNKEINDKSHMTEEENNHLAEKICIQDMERLWNSDIVIACPEQSAIGSMCETGVLYGWKYMANRLENIIYKGIKDDKDAKSILKELDTELERIKNKENHFHYFDIRTNHLNEKDWRRSFSINQMLYGMILYASKDGKGIQDFDDIIKELQEKYPKK